MRLIEDHLEKTVFKAFQKKIPVVKGPFTVSKMTGVQPEVFIHASQLIDFGGVMADGSETTRRPAQGPSTFRGFEEERPGRIVLIVTCVSGSHTFLQEMCSVVLPIVLASLQLMPKIQLGSLPNDSTRLHFEDFTGNIHQMELKRVVENDISFYKGELIFYLNGFIHLYVTKRGGFHSKSASRSKLKS